MRIAEEILDRAAEQFEADCCLKPLAIRNGKKESAQVRIGRTPSLPRQGFWTDAAYAGLVRERMEGETGKSPRIYEGTDPFFRAIFGLGRVWMMADSRIYDWCVKSYLSDKGRPEWFGQFADLRELDDQLRRYGRQIMDSRLHFLPAAGGKRTGLLPKLRWYEENELWGIRDPWPFRHALCSSEQMPGKLAVAAVVDTETAAMAGAAADCPGMWQIDVDVRSKWEGKGLGAALVHLLAEEILRRGKIPFYATASSHIRSVNTALAAGFLPAWTEVYVRNSGNNRS